MSYENRFKCITSVQGLMIGRSLYRGNTQHTSRGCEKIHVV